MKSYQSDAATPRVWSFVCFLIMWRQL